MTIKFIKREQALEKVDLFDENGLTDEESYVALKIQYDIVGDIVLTDSNKNRYLAKRVTVKSKREPLAEWPTVETECPSVEISGLLLDQDGEPNRRFLYFKDVYVSDADTTSDAAKLRDKALARFSEEEDA